MSSKRVNDSLSFMPSIVARAKKRNYFDTDWSIFKIPLFLAILVYAQGRFQYLATRPLEIPRSEIQKPNPHLFRALTVGNTQVGVDWLLVRFLAQSSYIKSKSGENTPAYFDLDLATELDPGFFELYTGGANLLAVVLNDKSGAKELLIKADRFRKNELPNYPEEFRKNYWARAWNIPVLLGYVYLFEFEDLPHASIAFQEAAMLTGAPEYLTHLSERLKKPGGEYEVGMRLLGFMMGNAPNETAREELEMKKKSLFIGQFLFQLNDSFRSYLKSIKEYRSQLSITPGKMEKYLTHFLKESGYSVQDPWGGKLFLDVNSQIASTTPHRKVFGLE